MNVSYLHIQSTFMYINVHISTFMKNTHSTVFGVLTCICNYYQGVMDLLHLKKKTICY